MTDRETPKSYFVEVELPAGRDEVWDAVTQPAVLRQWFGWDYDELDVEIAHIFVNEATLRAPERMGWADGSYLEVSGDDDSAVVRAVREGVDDPGRYDAIEEGWRAFLVQLRYLLAERPRGERRTLYLTGASTWRQVLGMTGSTAATVTRAGTRVAWLVDGDGHLVVLAGREPLGSRSAGRFEVTVSTFGLDDSAFEVIRKRWTERWAPLARNAQVTAADTPAP
ncbi:activator of HSP90 ATPase [Symbioplanes lichenis]|uniref:activator of HSP90 ATPase n=1 Tax=Symbioplanes lichenis TaxID=1629072 RepID=UPI00273968A3|nr:activator of HSP90 ATPase [Actinoplanes lichenis]